MPNDTANILIQNVECEVDLASGGEIEAFQHRDERCKADGESGQQEVKGDDPGELHPGKNNRIQVLEPLSLNLQLSPIARWGRAARPSGAKRELA